MSESVFYSWQSDLPNRCNRGAIELALQAALRAIGRDASLQLAPRLDKDTAGVPGSPEIGSTILAKIDAAAAFVADVSIVSEPEARRPTPNPNVLLELGYALKALGTERVIMVSNDNFGSVEALPFDLRFKRVLTYKLSEEESPSEARKTLSAKLETALRLVFDHLRDAERAAGAGAFASRLADELISFLSVAQQMRDRYLNPWFDNAQYQLKVSAAAFRDLAVPDEATSLGVADDLRQLGKLADVVTRHVSALGSENWEEYLAKVDAAVALALVIKRKVVDVLPLDAGSKRSIVNVLTESMRRLQSLAAEATEEMESDGYEQWEEIRDKASEVGQTLLRISYLPSLSDIIDEEELRPIAVELHQLEMIEQREFGRNDIDECLAAVVSLTSRLQELMKK